MNALDNINDKTPPFLGLENPMTALEFAIWFTDRGTTAVDMNIAAAELATKDEQIAALRERAEKLETAAGNLFQACSDLPLPEMDRMEKEINELADALREAQ